MTKAVAFIGRPKHLELRLADDADFPLVVKEIKEKWKEGGRFFEGSPRVRVIGSLRENERKTLSSMLVDDYGIPEVEFIGNIRNEKSLFPVRKANKKQSIPSFDFLSRNSAQVETDNVSFNMYERFSEEDESEPLELHSEVSNVRESNALFVLETVRNGQRVAYDGDIVVLGDANAGSELIATGSIVVLGALRGMAHAGSAGDEEASVSAYRLSPKQLRIGAQMAIAPDDAKEMAFSEIATVKRGEIVILPACSMRRTKRKISPGLI